MATQRKILEQDEKGRILNSVFLVDGEVVPEGKKYCNACETIKDITTFSPKGNSCKECANARSRARYSSVKVSPEWLENRNKVAKERHRERKQEIVTLMGNECFDCKQQYPLNVYDFHHLDPSEKEHNIGNILRKKSLEEVMKEVSKCVLLCSNCHRIRHGED